MNIKDSTEKLGNHNRIVNQQCIKVIYLINYLKKNINAYTIYDRRVCIIYLGGRYGTPWDKVACGKPTKLLVDKNRKQPRNAPAKIFVLVRPHPVRLYDFILAQLYSYSIFQRGNLTFYLGVE